MLGLDQDLKNDIWNVVRVEYSGQYTSIEDFFNYDEDPRIFYFDTAGSGLYDTYFPDFDQNDWVLIDRADHEIDQENLYAYSFLTYERKA